jgi:prepilin-type N-terminal cleavage/methylation domain-containing protein
MEHRNMKKQLQAQRGSTPYHFSSKKSDTGFTLIELIVVMAIFTFLTTVILANNARFGGVILLENLAYDIGLSIRKAQVYGIAVRGFGGSDFDLGYGIHFDSATPTTYVLFGDVYPTGAGNGLYESDQGELVESITMQGGFRVANVCATAGGGAEESCGLGTLDIFFRRPEPDAYISANGVSGVVDQAALQQQGRILLESPRGDQISVVIEATGQIAVQ